MLKNYANVTESDLKDADGIFAIDSNDPSRSMRLDGHNAVPRIASPNSPAHEVRVLDVEIDFTNERELQELIEKVEAAQGYLSPETQRLKNDLLLRREAKSADF